MTSHRRASRSVLGLGLAALLALGACEKGPDRAQVAAELKSGVEEQLKKLEGTPEQKVLSHTAVNVTPQDDDAYLVSIEGLKIQPAARGQLEIGTISYLAKRKDEKTYEVSDLKLPPAMPFKSPDGKEKGKLTIATKAFSGIYSKELENFQKLDAEFADISATDDEGGDVRIASAKFNGAVTEKGGGMADSIGTVVLSGLTAKEQNGGIFVISEIRGDGKYDSINVAQYRKAMARYQELLVKQAALVEGAGATGQAQQPTPAEQQALAEDQKAMTDAISSMAGAIKGGDFKIAFKGMKYSEGGVEPFALGELSLGTLIDGINQDKAILNVDIAHKDLAMAVDEMTSPIDQAVLPRNGNLSLKVTEIPSKDLVKVLADNLPSVMSADEMVAEANAKAMFVALEAVFQSSGAKIEVAPSQLVSQLIEMKAGGNFSVNAQAMFGIVGGLDVAIRGMDDLLALAQKTPEDYDAQQAIGSVGMLQQYSQREQGADGKPVDKFKIELNAAGQLTVNGKPM